MEMKEGLTFDDVTLVPYYSNLNSRTEPALTTKLTKNVTIQSPIIASNMESVIGPELGRILIEKGSMPIFHRFGKEEDIVEWIKQFPNTFISWGVTNLGTLFRILDKGDSLPLGIAFDVAHGHTKFQKEAIKAVKDYSSTLEVIGGNVCSKTAVHDMADWGADAIRVGVGAGAICITRMVTGFGIPQLTAIMDCVYVAKQRGIPVIADGGIRDSRDIVLSLAAGASTVMTGKLFAGTIESAAIKAEGKARYRGQASEAFQRPGLAAEGVEGWIPVTGSASEFMDNLHMQLKSGLAMGGARSIEELQRHAKFMRVTHSFMAESKPRV